MTVPSMMSEIPWVLFNRISKDIAHADAFNPPSAACEYVPCCLRLMYACYNFLPCPPLLTFYSSFLIPLTNQYLIIAFLTCPCVHPLFLLICPGFPLLFTILRAYCLISCLSQLMPFPPIYTHCLGGLCPINFLILVGFYFLHEATAPRDP